MRASWAAPADSLLRAERHSRPSPAGPTFGATDPAGEAGARDGDPAHRSLLRPCRGVRKEISPARPGRLGRRRAARRSPSLSSAGRSRLCGEVSPPGRRAAAAAAALPPRPLLTCIDVTASPGFPWKHGAAKNSNPPSQPRTGSRQPLASGVADRPSWGSGGGELGPEEREHTGGDSHGGGRGRTEVGLEAASPVP